MVFAMNLIDSFKDWIGFPASDEELEEPTPEKVIETHEDKRNKVVNIHATAQLQVILVKPEQFADTKQIADHLTSRKTIVLNLEATSPEVTRRIIDFLGGVAYANGGNIKPVANNTFIITPYNVGFVGEDLVGELESNGVLL